MPDTLDEEMGKRFGKTLAIEPTVEGFIAVLREKFQSELERTGGYTKPGMTLALERAIVAALLTERKSGGL